MKTEAVGQVENKDKIVLKEIWHRKQCYIALKRREYQYSDLLCCTNIDNSTADMWHDFPY